MGTSYSIKTIHLLLHSRDLYKHNQEVSQLQTLRSCDSDSQKGPFSIPSALIPKSPGIKPHKRLRAQLISLPKQLCNIDVQRTIRLGVRQQLLHGLERLRDRIRRTPRRLEQIEADLARLEVHVRMTDGRQELYCWWL